MAFTFPDLIVSVVALATYYCVIEYFKGEHDSGIRYIVVPPTDPRGAIKTLAKGYREYNKHGLPFRMQLKECDMVVLPMKYLEEWKFVGEDVASPWNNGLLASSLTPSRRLRNSIKALDFEYHVTDLHCMIQVCLEKDLPQSKGWEKVKMGQVCLELVMKALIYLLCGRKVATSEDWNDLIRETVSIIVEEQEFVKRTYPKHLHWVTPSAERLGKRMEAVRERAKQIVREELPHEKNADGGLLLSVGDGEQASNELACCLLSGQGGLELYSSVCHLLEHEGIIERVREEVGVVLQGNGECWTHDVLAQLSMMDAFLAESERMAPINYTALRRHVNKPHKFKDSLVLPTGVVACLPLREVNFDPEYIQQPKVFNVDRLETKEQHPFSGVEISDRSFTRHTHTVLKIVLAELLTKYELRGEKVGDVVHELCVMKDLDAVMEVRRR